MTSGPSRIKGKGHESEEATPVRRARAHDLTDAVAAAGETAHRGRADERVSADAARITPEGERELNSPRPSLRRWI
jgi:hypothetical protein